MPLPSSSLVWIVTVPGARVALLAGSLAGGALAHPATDEASSSNVSVAVTRRVGDRGGVRQGRDRIIISLLALAGRLCGRGGDCSRMIAVTLADMIVGHDAGVHPGEHVGTGCYGAPRRLGRTVRQCWLRRTVRHCWLRRRRGHWPAGSARQLVPPVPPRRAWPPRPPATSPRPCRRPKRLLRSRRSGRRARNFP